jgi:hypothetical protein
VDRGFGFINSEDVAGNIFFHVTNIVGSNNSILIGLINEQVQKDGNLIQNIPVTFMLEQIGGKAKAYNVKLSDTFTSFIEIGAILQNINPNSANFEEKILNILSFELLCNIQKEKGISRLLLEKFVRDQGIFEYLLYISNEWLNILPIFNEKRPRIFSNQEISLLTSFSHHISDTIKLSPKSEISVISEIPAIIQPIIKPDSPLKFFRDFEDINLIFISNETKYSDLISFNRLYPSNGINDMRIFVFLENPINNFTQPSNKNRIFLYQNSIIKSIMNMHKEQPVVIGQLLRDSTSQIELLSEKFIQPYDTSTSYKEHLFIGRSQERKKILADKTSNFVVYGGRRIGKTWFLQDLCTQCKKQTDYSADYYPFYVSLQTAWNIESAVDLIVERINYEISVKSEAKNPLTKLGNILINTHKTTKKTILLCLDELDLFFKSPEHMLFFERLRQLQSTYPMAFKYVFAGFKELIHVFYEKAVQNPFFHWIGNNQIPLGCLSESELKDLVILLKWVGLEFDERIILQKIYDITSGHPFYTQNLCSKIVETRIKSNSYLLNAQHIDKLATLEFTKEIFNTFEGNLTNLQKVIGKLFTKQSNAINEKEILILLKDNFGIDLSPKFLQEQLEVLQACSVISWGESGYFPIAKWINEEFFKRYDDDELVYIYMEHPNE